jgi:mannose-6-phosphate isomerase-like protein (cupin superfamily)
MEPQFGVVKRDTIPPLRSIEQKGETLSIGEVRDFNWNAELREFLQNVPDLCVSWATLKHGDVHKPHTHPIQSMMVIYSGSGELIGDLCRTIRAGDVVVIPAGCSHGFIGGPEGLSALAIQLGEGLYTNPDKPRMVPVEDDNSLQSLLAFTRKCLGAFQKRPIFDLMKDGTLASPSKRRAYLDALETWREGHWAVVLTRLAGCREGRYEAPSFERLQAALSDPGNCRGASSTATPDARMEAFTTWFVHQMYVLDDAEKAALVHLVLEPAAVACFGQTLSEIAKHAEAPRWLAFGAGGDPLEKGAEVLRDESPHTYSRLRKVVGEGWDMLGGMADRVAELGRTG